MVDAVNSISVIQNTASRSGAQGGGGSVASAVSEAAAEAQAYVSSSIRVDNLQNVAILEFRSGQTGEVVAQYPNQSQIEAFKEAQRIAEQASRQPSAASADVPSSSSPSPAVSRQFVTQSADNNAPVSPPPSSSGSGPSTSVLA